MRRLIIVALAFLLVSIVSASADAGESRNGIFCFEQDVAEHIAERLGSAPGTLGIERAKFALAVHGGRTKVVSIVNFHTGGRLEAPICSCGIKESLFFGAERDKAMRVITVEQHVRLGILPDSIISTQYYIIGSDAVCPLKPTS